MKLFHTRWLYFPVISRKCCLINNDVLGLFLTNENKLSESYSEAPQKVFYQRA